MPFSTADAPTTGNGSDAPILAIRQLTRRFGRRTVVEGLDVDLLAGERVALRGANGSGKTTVLRCVAGTLTPTSGTVSIGGFPAGSMEARELVGTSFSQDRSFYWRLSGRANLTFFARLRDLTRREAARRVRELEEELELRAILTERVDRCSTGMVQQLAFARALLHEPRLLLLDEPTRSLDEDARRRVWAALGRRPETAALIATHLTDDVDRCDQTLEFPRLAS